MTGREREIVFDKLFLYTREIVSDDEQWRGSDLYPKAAKAGAGGMSSFSVCCYLILWNFFYCEGE